MISETNFEYLVNITYNRSYSCEESGCEEEGICRCSRMDDIKVTNIIYNDILDKIYSLYFNNSIETNRNNKLNNILHNINEKIERYTIDRILRKYQIWENKAWEFKVSPSYYGEELDYIHLSNASDIDNDIRTALSISDINERIEYLLYLEYGSLMPKLIGANYTLKTIKKSDIIIGNKEYNTQLNKTTYYTDEEYDLIRCLVLEQDDKYKLIDGYHRVSSTNKGNVLALVAKKPV